MSPWMLEVFKICLRSHHGKGTETGEVNLSLPKNKSCFFLFGILGSGIKLEKSSAALKTKSLKNHCLRSVL